MEGSKITGIRDVDKLILSNMDTRTFLNTYQIKNKYVHSLFDENVFKNRVEKEFPRLVNSKGDRLWKNYYFDLVYWAEKLKEKYGFESNDFRAHPEKYFDIFVKTNPGYLLEMASQRGYIDLMKHAISIGNKNYQKALHFAAYTGQMESFEYLRNNVPFDYDLNEALDYARDGMKPFRNNIEMIEHIQTLIKNR